MAFDEGTAEILRGDLDGLPGLTERRMFGGLAFLLDGHMVSGVHRGGAMYRVGAARQGEALAIHGTSRMTMGGKGRVMSGMIAADEDLLADDDRRRRLLAIALDVVRSLPPKK